MELKGMNDKFLYQYRQPPDPRFAQALYQRISAEAHAPTRLQITVTPLFAPVEQIARTLNLLSMAAAVAWAVSPGLRSRIFKQVFGFL